MQLGLVNVEHPSHTVPLLPIFPASLNVKDIFIQVLYKIFVTFILFILGMGWARESHGTWVEVRDSLGELVLLFYHVGPVVKLQAIGLGDKHLHTLSHLTGPQ